MNFHFKILLAALLLSQVQASTFKLPGSAYTSDEHTVLLEHFDGGTSGAAVGNVSYGVGVYGQAAQLDNSSYIGWSLGVTPNGTVEFWGNLSSLETVIDAPTFVWAYLSSAFVGQGPGNTLKVNVHEGMPGAGFHVAPFNALGAGPNSERVTEDSWHHYALTWGNAGLQFYLDGELIGSNSTGQPMSQTSYWVVGNASELGFDGLIDELRISDIQRTFTPFVRSVPEGGNTALLMLLVIVGAIGGRAAWMQERDSRVLAQNSARK